ncbi:MAG: hypothetical protein ACW987_18760, partial [Candidatus Thorarchaeota archaeon]
AFQLLPANPGRTKIVVSADSANEAFFLKLGPTQSLSVSDYTYRIPASGNLVIEAPMYTGIVSVVQGAADGNIMVTEFSKLEFNY